MSSIISGYSPYGSNSLLLNNSVFQNQQSNQSQSSRSGSDTTTLRRQIDELLKNVPKGDDGKLSFKDVENYLKAEEKKWDDGVKADLEELGVKTYQQFPLKWDPAQGTVTVADGHPDKAIIDKYFKDNPDKVEKFEEIIQIGKLTRTATTNLSPLEIKQSIQKQSMAIWFEDNSDPTSWFSGGGMMFGAGQGAYTGLNIKV